VLATKVWRTIIKTAEIIVGKFGKLKLIIALTFSLVGDPSLAWYVEEANPRTVGSISVVLEDEATGACWTNLRESRLYAEEKLEQRGYCVTGETSKYDLYINVGGGRLPNDVCVYSIEVSVLRYTEVEGVWGVFQIGSRKSFGTHSDNVNRNVIEAISDMTDEM
jgi:hypothetical protein